MMKEPNEKEACEMEEMPQEYKIRARFDDIEFSGWVIGRASARTDKSLRWTEIIIYRTAAGKFVVQRLGCSVVYHRYPSACKSSGKVIKGSDIPDTSEPCDRCDPDVPEDEGFDPAESFRHEVMMSSADVVDSADKIRDALTLHKPGGTKYLSSVASKAMEDAVRNDPALLDAFHRQITVD